MPSLVRSSDINPCQFAAFMDGLAAFTFRVAIPQQVEADAPALASQAFIAAIFWLHRVVGAVSFLPPVVGIKFVFRHVEARRMTSKAGYLLVLIDEVGAFIAWTHGSLSIGSHTIMQRCFSFPIPERAATFSRSVANVISPSLGFTWARIMLELSPCT